jgi:predicted lipoprotein
MKLIKTSSAALFVIFLALSCTAVKTDTGKRTEVAFYFDNDKFDAKQYVGSIWDESVIPYMTEKAADAGELVRGLEDDPESMCEKYGYRAVKENNPFNFSLKGTVRILSVGDGSNARAEADLEPYDGAADLIIQVGPIFKGTSIRDFLDFIRFEDFTNQVDFAKLANELNFKVRDDVMKQFDFKNDPHIGDEFEIIGAATYPSGDPKLVVMPVVMELKGRPE